MSYATLARPSLLLLSALSVLLSVGCSDEPLALGEACSVASPGDCESGICAESPGSYSSRGICSQACSAAEACPTVAGIGRLTCNPETSECVTPCAEETTLPVGAETFVCRSGEYDACSDLTDIDCDICGCGPFAGSVCIAGVGCVDPQPDGSSCDHPEECTSGACFYSSSTCGSARAIGEACHADEDCETANCSNDGNHAVAGVCNMAFGTRCSGHTQCNQCESYDAFYDGWCIRTFCNPDDAHPCPTGISTGGTGSRRWDCRESQDGQYRCFENCTTQEGYYYNCLDDFDTCHESFSGDYCY